MTGIVTNEIFFQLASKRFQKLVSNCDPAFLSDLWTFVADYTRLQLQRERTCVIPGFMTFGLIENSMNTGTHGIKQELHPKGNFHNKFLIDFKIEAVKFPINSKFPASEVDFGTIAQKLETTTYMVTLVFKLLVQEIGRFTRDEVASHSCSGLKLVWGNLGTLTCKRRNIQFDMHPDIRKGSSRQIIEIDRIGPQKYSGQREYLLLNKTKTHRREMDPHSISTVRPMDPLRYSLRSSQGSPRTISSRSVYSTVNLTMPEKKGKNTQSRPSTSLGIQNNKNCTSILSIPGDLPPLNPELQAFFKNNT